MPRVIVWAIFAAVVCLTGACGPRVQKAGGLDVAPGISGGVFTAADGKTMKAKLWMPPSGDPEFIVVGLHGFNDYREAFSLPAETLTAMGVAVTAFDQRGFGADDQAGIWAGGERMATDAAEFVRQIRRAFPGKPVYFIGSSMGGAVAILSLAGDRPAPADGVILAAPAVWGWSTMNLFYRVSLWVTAHALPGWTLTGEGLDVQPSDNIDELIKMSRDPLVIKKTRIDAVYGLVNLMEEALDSAGDVNIPVLLLYGGRDEVIPKDSIDRLVENFGAGIDYHELPDSFHMLLRDRETADVYRLILDFMRDTAPKRFAETSKGMVNSR